MDTFLREQQLEVCAVIRAVQKEPELSIPFCFSRNNRQRKRNHTEDRDRKDCSLPPDVPLFSSPLSIIKGVPAGECVTGAALCPHTSAGYSLTHQFLLKKKLGKLKIHFYFQ